MISVKELLISATCHLVGLITSKNFTRLEESLR
jgi:hypothetical protein